MRDQSRRFLCLSETYDDPNTVKDTDNPRKWIIDDEAAEVVHRIYRLCVEGKGIETTARILQEDGILVPTQYWEEQGQGKEQDTAHRDPL